MTTRKRFILRTRAGFSLIEVLLVALLLGVCAAGITKSWSLCYSMNDQARQMQGGKDIVEQEMERVRRLNWTGLPEQTSWPLAGSGFYSHYYDAGGNAVVASDPRGFVSFIKVETLTNTGLSLAQTPTVDATGGTSRSLRRVTIVVQPTGALATATPPTAQAVTYLTLGGP